MGVVEWVKKPVYIGRLVVDGIDRWLKCGMIKQQRSTVSRVITEGQRQLSIGTRRWLVITLIDCEDGQTDGAIQWPYV